MMKPTVGNRPNSFHLLAPCLAVTMCVFSLATGYSHTKSSSERWSPTTTPTTQVHLLSAPGLPVSLQGQIVLKGEDSLVFDYSLANLTAGPVRNFELALYILTKQGKIKGGQVWRLTVELPARGAQDFSLRLTNKPKPDETVIAAVQEVTQDWKAWKVDAMSFANLAQVSVTNQALATAHFVAYRPDEGDCPADFCDRQSAAADRICNRGQSCGIRNFTCDQTACTASWDCAPCQPEM